MHIENIAGQPLLTNFQKDLHADRGAETCLAHFGRIRSYLTKKRLNESRRKLLSSMLVFIIDKSLRKYPDNLDLYKHFLDWEWHYFGPDHLIDRIDSTLRRLTVQPKEENQDPQIRTYLTKRLLLALTSARDIESRNATTVQHNFSRANQKIVELRNAKILSDSVYLELNVRLITGYIRSGIAADSANAPDLLTHASDIVSSLAAITLDDKFRTRRDRIVNRLSIYIENTQVYRVVDTLRRVGVRHTLLDDGVSSCHLIVTELGKAISAYDLNENVLVYCFQGEPTTTDLLHVSSDLRKREIIDGGQIIAHDRTACFIAVPDVTDSVLQRTRAVLAQRTIAIVPLDDTFYNIDRSADIQAMLLGLLAPYMTIDAYASSIPVHGQDFFGRQEDLGVLRNQIDRGEFVGIYGLRKIGKTSIVDHLSRSSLADYTAVAKVDLQSSIAVEENDCRWLYWELEKSLAEHLQALDLNAPPSDYGDAKGCLHRTLLDVLTLAKHEDYRSLDFKTVRVDFIEDIKRWLRILAANDGFPSRILFVLDEIERLIPRPGWERDSSLQGIPGCNDFFSTLRGLNRLAGAEGRLSTVVLAANSAVSEIAAWPEGENPVTSYFVRYMVPPFEKSDCQTMVVALGNRMAVQWQPEALNAVFSETNGHPYLTRMFCSRIVRERMRPLTVTAEMVEDAARTFVLEPGGTGALDAIVYLLQTWFKEDYDALLDLVRNGRSDQLDPVNIGRLVSYYLVHRDEESKCYRLSIPLLDRYLRSRYS